MCLFGLVGDVHRFRVFLPVFCPVRALVSGGMRIVSAFFPSATLVVYELVTCCLVCIPMLR